MPGKYSPLEHYLLGLPAGQMEVTLSYEQVERILNDNLPPSALVHRAWWSNETVGTHIHAHAWLNAGWKVDAVNFTNRWVRFADSSPFPLRWTSYVDAGLNTYSVGSLVRRPPTTRFRAARVASTTACWTSPPALQHPASVFCCQP